MKIYLASDHAGYDLKQFLDTHLRDLGHEVEDCGALENNPLDDYPDFFIPAAVSIVNTRKFGNFSGVTPALRASINAPSQQMIVPL